MSVLAGRKIAWHGCFPRKQQEFSRSRRRIHASSIRSAMPRNESRLVLSTKRVLKNAAAGAAAALCLAVASVAAAPSLLSWPQGLSAALWVANHAIPGSISIGKASLGWNKPLRLEAIFLKDDKEETVLWIQEIVSTASLWSIVSGRSGLGTSTVGPFRINLLEDEKTGLLKLALAIEPAHRLLRSKRQPSTPKKKPPKEPPVTVKLTGEVRATNGGLVLRDGRILLPADIAATLGSTVLVDVLLGKDADELNLGVPNAVKLTMWSDCAHAEAIGYFNPAAAKLQLVKPIVIEMDLTPEVARIYLFRVNPLLGNIVAPAVAEEDLPDISLRVTTKDMLFPADEYVLRFEPMKVVLARGPLVDTLLSLLSKEDVIQGKGEMKMETTAIQATADTNGFVSCSRIDLLIGGKVHVATWGQVDIIEEHLKMTLAVPSSTLKAVLALKKLPIDYHLRVPITGSFERPQMDVKAAGISIAQLMLHERAGSFASLLGALESPGEPLPAPIAAFPWAQKSNG